MGDTTRFTRATRWDAASALVFTALFTLVLLVKPGGPDLVRAVGDLANVVGPLIAVSWCMGWGWRRPPAQGASPTSPTPPTLPTPPERRSWAPLLLGLGALSFVLGQSIWAYDELIARQETPFPSAADAGYLAGYPLVLLGILALPGRSSSLAARLRVLLDGVMIMVALVTVSWYVILGPTLLQAHASVLAKLVATAYPLSDLVLLLCLLLLLVRTHHHLYRSAIILLSGGVGILTLANAIYDDQLLHGSYRTGELIDPGWALGYLVLGLGARALRTAMTAPSAAAPRASHPGVGAPPSRAAPLWWSLLPYALVPAGGAAWASTSGWARSSAWCYCGRSLCCGRTPGSTRA